MPYQQDYWWMWCLFLVLGFGGCIGSFLNVIVYRIPRSLTIGRPQWSFCPSCGVSIRWTDNIPVFSYFRLGGRCRHCSAAIPVRYLLIEVITVLVFLILFDAFFVATLLNGVTADPWTTPAYRFSQDWPIYAAHVLLFSCLIAMSAIDMEQYWVDIRFTHLAALCGFVLHALWTPQRIPSWPRPGSTAAAATLSAMLIAVITHLTLSWLWRRRQPQEAGAAQESAPEPQATMPPSSPQPVGTDRPAAGETTRSARPAAWLAVGVLTFTLALLVLRLSGPPPEPPEPPPTPAAAAYMPGFNQAFALRTLPGVVFIFAVLVAGGTIKRASDQEIAHALEAERHQARGVVLRELATLLPTVGALAAGVLLFAEGGPFAAGWERAWQWELIRGIRPVVGLGTAAAGFIVAGMVGWTVRVFFTLVLGKEAFGTGDIHIMAAAGAVMGWEAVVVGFFISSVLALVGWLMTLPFKRGHALPMGPWITLALFVTLLIRDPVITPYLEATWYKLSFLLPSLAG